MSNNTSALYMVKYPSRNSIFCINKNQTSLNKTFNCKWIQYAKRFKTLGFSKNFLLKGSSKLTKRTSLTARRPAMDNSAVYRLNSICCVFIVICKTFSRFFRVPFLLDDHLYVGSYFKFCVSYRVS